STVTKVGFGERHKSSGSAYGVGDISVGLAKTLLREDGGWWPDLVGRVRWDTDTGKSSDGGVPLGGGFNEIAGSLSAVKRQDPLAFVAGISYERAFEHNNVRPGDELGFSIGTVLAASPETSLSLSLSQGFSDEVELDGRGVDGSDQVNGVLSIGAASILGGGLFVNTTVDIGLTDDAPDYAVRASVPIRFSLPGY
ncbi:MAG: transporter, partial [Geminicoccaceae bacterium]